MDVNWQGAHCEAQDRPRRLKSIVAQAQALAICSDSEETTDHAKLRGDGFHRTDESACGSSQEEPVGR